MGDVIRYRKLGYVELMVTDVDRSAAFYRDLGGLEPAGNGNTLPMASKWKFSGSVSYDAEVASVGKATFDLTASYSSKFPWDADNLWYESAHLLLNSSVTLAPEALENVSLRFWMKNITNRKVNLGYYAQASGSAFGSAPAAPRTYGLEASFRW